MNGVVLMMSLQTMRGDLVRDMGGVLRGVGTVSHMGECIVHPHL